MLRVSSTVYCQLLPSARILGLSLVGTEVTSNRLWALFLASFILVSCKSLLIVLSLVLLVARTSHGF